MQELLQHCPVLFYEVPSLGNVSGQTLRRRVKNRSIPGLESSMAAPVCVFDPS